MLLKDDPRPESPPPPPLWMGIVTGLSLVGAFWALMLGDYRIADVGIILSGVVSLLLTLRRYRERRRQVGRTRDQKS